MLQIINAVEIQLSPVQLLKNTHEYSMDTYPEYYNP